MIIPARPLNDITSQAIHVLTKEMGAADTMRFLGQFSVGTGNYTEERTALFDHLELDDLLAEIRETGSIKNPIWVGVTTMQPWRDPIVEDLHATRERLAKPYHDDWMVYSLAAEAHCRELGFRIVDSPRRPVIQDAPGKGTVTT